MNVVGEGEVPQALAAAEFVGEGFDDAEFGFHFRRLDINGAAAVEARFQTLVELDVLGSAVGGKHHLLALAGQRVEQLEKHVHGFLLALKVLDIIEEEDVRLLVVGAEVAEADLLLILDGAGL